MCTCVCEFECVCVHDRVANASEWRAPVLPASGNVGDEAHQDYQESLHAHTVKVTDMEEEIVGQVGMPLAIWAAMKVCFSPFIEEIGIFPEEETFHDLSSPMRPSEVHAMHMAPLFRGTHVALDGVPLRWCPPSPSGSIEY